MSFYLSVFQTAEEPVAKSRVAGGSRRRRIRK